MEKLSRDKPINVERQPDVDFSVNLSDNLGLMDPGLTPACRSCTYMIDNILDMRTEKVKKGSFRVLTYSVCTMALKPFLLFKLVVENGTCTFPKVRVSAAGRVPDNGGHKYQGIVDGTDVLAYEMEYSDPDVVKVTARDTDVYVTVDDIVNQKHTFGRHIDESVISFFLAREELVYLQDSRGELVETPMSAYRGEYYKMIGLLAGLGVPRAGPYSALGPYFKFADYARALRFGVVTLSGKPQLVGDEKITREESPVFTKGGIVKYVLFLGNTKVLLNLPTDPDDDSSESVKLAAERPFIKATLKLRDSAGKWAASYDSVMQPLITIYDTELKRNRVLDPQVVVREFRQQHPLQYGYLDTSGVSLDEATGFYKVDEAVLE